MGLVMFFCDFFWEGGGILPLNIINLPRTYEKVPCKGDSVHTDRQTGTQIYFIFSKTSYNLKFFIFLSAKSCLIRINFQKLEPYLPSWNKSSRVLFTYSLILVMVRGNFVYHHLGCT